MENHRDPKIFFFMSTSTFLSNFSFKEESARDSKDAKTIVIIAVKSNV